MRITSCAIAAAAVFAATAASAQAVNLTGTYRCIQGCRVAPVGSLAFVTQNGWNLNLVNEAGQPSRAWPDAFAPFTKIWADDWNVSAVYSPDGMTIQFDNGTIWQRDIGPPPPAPGGSRAKTSSAEVMRSRQAVVVAAGSPTCNGRATANR
jgi:hypothetical protein